MIRFLFDEHIDPPLVRGLHRELVDLDILEARLTLGGTPDEALIEFASREGRVLVTRDVPDHTAKAGASQVAEGR